MFFGGFLFLFFVAATGVMLWGVPLPRAFFLHGVFALAALPLMWAAMLHFVPVLTRSDGAGRGMRLLPWLAMAVGGVLLSVLGGLLPRHVLLLLALLLASGALTLLLWMRRRVRRALGQPHPCVLWYVAALVFLCIGLGAVFGMVLDSARFGLWYRLHLHANLFGWIGLTVLGTLPVLLPTSMSQRDSRWSQKNDPDAAFRLRLGLPWAAGGVGLIMLSAAVRAPAPGMVGALALLAVLVFHWKAWGQLYGAPWRWPGPAISLLMGTVFFALLLVLGVAQGAGWVGGVYLLPAFAAGFLLPTVLGALAQLLPVWRFPGPDTPARETFRRALARGAGVRGVLCVLAGVGQFFLLPSALALAGFAVGWMLLVVIWASRPRSTQPPSAL